jgi:DNA helicase-2/ATP-dependent DNA helicase PcrA
VSAAKNAGFGLGKDEWDQTREYYDGGGRDYRFQPEPNQFPAIEDYEAWESLLTHFSIDDDLLDNNISIPHGIEMAQFLLLQSNRATGSVDFDDMIYLPLLLNLKIPQHDNVIIDEAQDISATRYELAARACAERGRMIAVGDPNQAIYGFTGADAESLPNIIRRQNAVVLPLSVCFRCDASIIAAAQAWVPGIEARPGAPAGTVDELDCMEFLDAPIPLGSAVLCRLNRPNVAVALQLMRRDVPVKIEGRDLGKALLEHIKKAEPLYASTDGYELLTAVEDYRERRSGELLARNKVAAASLFEDEIDGAILLIEKVLETRAANVWQGVEALVAQLFADDIPPRGLVTLSSVHKAKGREWPRVYVLGREDYMPFWMAQKPWEQEQEGNLIYVAYTRAERHLTLINGVKEWLDNR